MVYKYGKGFFNVKAGRVLFALLVFQMFCLTGFTQKNSGIFYTSILAKEMPYKRIAGFGTNATAYFLKDVNGDGKDDAVSYFNTGKWNVAVSDGTNFTNPGEFLAYTPANTATNKLIPLMGDVNGDDMQDAVFFDPELGNWIVGKSDGTSFTAPVPWATGNGVGSTKQFLADVNGDGFDDAIIYFHTGLDGYWLVGLSTGTSSFGGFGTYITGFGNTADQHFLADVNGDGKADAVYFDISEGNWQVALSDGARFTEAGTWKTGFGVNADKGFVYDVDMDGKADIAFYQEGRWVVSYSNGTAFSSGAHTWVTGNRPPTMNSRSNRPAPEEKLIGTVSGTAAGATAISVGDWLIIENTNKSNTIAAPTVSTWDAWGNPYIPQLPGHVGTYDAGDPSVNDIQIKLMHDAGFTYIMLDITNGNNPWVDDRAKRFIERIIHFNNNLQPGQHKMFFCISMGGARGKNGQEAADAIDAESQRTWDEFYVPYADAYYQMDGKPFLVHFVWQPENSDEIKTFAAQMPNYQKFTVRWMYNEIKDEPKYANAYGWPILTATSNPAGDEVMDVSPGFWNGQFGNNRLQGDVFRGQWLRVLQNDPASIWLNSFNESWEHTSVEPAYLQPYATQGNSFLETWTDYHGTRMDDFYWVMTKQYNRLFMYKELFLNSYLQEDKSADIYVVREGSIEKHGIAKPAMAPVLLVPQGFISGFEGSVINEELQVIGTIVPDAGSGPVATNVEVSNLLTPNGDGKNDVWLIKDIEQYPDNVVKLYDASGKMLYNRKGYKNDWNGNHWGGSAHGGPVSKGVYLYVVDYGNGKIVKGYLTVLR